MLKRIIKAIIAHQEKRAAYYTLAKLSDKDLKDIGVTRGELRQKVYGL